MSPKDFLFTVLMAGTPLFVIIIFHILRINNLLPTWVFTQ